MAPIEPALRELAERARRDLGRHLDADELVAYHEGGLSEERVELVRDHLALCAECSGLLLDLASFSAPASPDAGDLTDGEVEEAWGDLEPRLAAESFGSPPPPQRRHSSLAIPWAIAASLLVGVIGLSAWVVVLRRDLRAHSRPRADVVVANLEPRGEGPRGVPDPGDGRLSADRPATLTFHASPARAYSRYELQIRPAETDGAVLWQERDLQPRELGVFVLDLPVGALAAGTYRVSLFGVDGNRREPVADYDLVMAAH